jgi:hypothetical protein
MMASLLHLKSDCRRILCESAKCRATITYGDLAKALGLPLARQEWNTVLDPLAKEERERMGRDLTQIVVYSPGHKLEGLGRYFSPKAPRTIRMDANNAEQRAAYRRELQAIFEAYAQANC